MRVLGLETSGDVSSVALVEGGHVLAERRFPSGMSLCQTLPGHLREVVGAQGEPACGLQVDAIGVSLGPGSFTGLRMGVALAKAMAHAGGVALVGISTPEAIAWPLAVAEGVTIAVVQRARRADVYLTVFACAAPGALELLTGPQVLAAGELPAALRDRGGPLLVAGDAAPAHREALLALGPQAHAVAPVLAAPRASVVAALAESRLVGEDGLPRAGAADPQAHLSLRPIYALASQAERAQGVDLGLS